MELKAISSHRSAQIGFPVNNKLVFNASFELPMFITFSDGLSNDGRGGAFYLPLLFGGGVEYLLQPNLSLTFKLALGVTISTNSPNEISSAAFTLETMAGIRLPGAADQHRLYGSR